MPQERPEIPEGSRNIPRGSHIILRVSQKAPKRRPEDPRMFKSSPDFFNPLASRSYAQSGLQGSAHAADP